MNAVAPSPLYMDDEPTIRVEVASNRALMAPNQKAENDMHTPVTPYDRAMDNLIVQSLEILKMLRAMDFTDGLPEQFSPVLRGFMEATMEAERQRGIDSMYDVVITGTIVP